MSDEKPKFLQPAPPSTQSDGPSIINRDQDGSSAGLVFENGSDPVFKHSMRFFQPSPDSRQSDYDTATALSARDLKDMRKAGKEYTLPSQDKNDGRG